MRQRLTTWIAAAIALLAASIIIAWIFPSSSLLLEILQLALVIGIVLAVLRVAGTLEKSEAKLRALVGSLDELILILDKDGRYIEIPSTNRSLLYRPLEQLIGRRIHEIFPADIADVFVAEIRRALASKQPTDVDYALPIDGKTLWFNAAVTRLDESRVLWVARDITERKAAELELENRVADRTRELRESEERYRSVFDQAEEIIYTLSREGFITSLNPAFERTLGWSVAEWIGKPFMGLVPPDQHAEAAALFADLLRTGHINLSRFLGLAKDGRRLAFELSVVEQHLRGDSVGFLGVARDVTERERAQAKLRQSEERFRMAMQATSEAMWDIDLVTGRSWHSEGYRTFGYQEGLVDHGYEWWKERLHPEDVDRIIAIRNEAWQKGQPSWSGEYRFRKGDGSYAHVLHRALIVRDANNEPTRVVGGLLDMTERKQLIDQLEQAKRVSSLGRVAASIAHEFNNVLMGIQPNVEAIQRSSPTGLRSMTDNIMRAVQRGKHVTDEILRFTRPAEPRRRSLEVSRFLATWGEHLAPSLEGLEITFDVPADAVHVAADPTQLAQIFTNLALNAHDAMQGGRGHFMIGARLVTDPDRSVQFTISDDGCGISSDRFAHIFEPLFTTKGGGIGLGLAITYQIVTRHGGQIAVESEIGRGSTFHISLPAALPETAPVEREESKIAPIHKLVLVEDEPAVASGIAMLLEMEGIDVRTVHTGRESIPAIEEFRPDAVILDIGLPDMDGVGVYLEIQRRWPQLAVLFSSGHGDSAKLESYLARPNVGFILKPYEFDAMRAALARLVDPKRTVEVS